MGCCYHRTQTTWGEQLQPHTADPASLLLFSQVVVSQHAHTHTHAHMRSRALVHLSFACLLSHWHMCSCLLLQGGELVIKDVTGQVQVLIKLRSKVSSSIWRSGSHQGDLWGFKWLLFCWVLQEILFICLVYFLFLPATLLWIIRCSFHVLLELFFLVSLLEHYFFIFKVKVKIGRSLQFNYYKSLCEFLVCLHA